MVTKCWKSVLTFWCWCASLAASRLNKIIFCWANSKSGRQCKNCHFRISKTLLDSGFSIQRFISENKCKAEVLRKVIPFITQRYINQWTTDIIRENARIGNGGNKLRLYRTFKQDFNVESCCKTVFNRSHRGALAKLRSGTVPVAIETGRYD